MIWKFDFNFNKSIELEPRCESHDTEEDDLRELCRRYLFNADSTGPSPATSMNFDSIKSAQVSS